MMRIGGEFTPLSEIAGNYQFSRTEPKTTVLFDLSGHQGDFPAYKLEVNLPYIHGLMARGQIGYACFSDTGPPAPPKAGVLKSTDVDVVQTDPLPSLFAQRWLSINVPFGERLQGGETAGETAEMLNRDLKNGLVRMGERHLVGGGLLPQEIKRLLASSAVGYTSALFSGVLGEGTLVQATAGLLGYTAVNTFVNHAGRIELKREFGAAGYRDTLFPVPHLVRGGELFVKSKIGTAIRARTDMQSS